MLYENFPAHYRRGLNPFENQVYFYAESTVEYVITRLGLNPFENQVYFYIDGVFTQAERTIRLNPFENQVYFYRGDNTAGGRVLQVVLIPLRIRSISTTGSCPTSANGQCSS